MLQHPKARRKTCCQWRRRYGASPQLSALSQLALFRRLQDFELKVTFPLSTTLHSVSLLSWVESLAGIPDVHGAAIPVAAAGSAPSTDVRERTADFQVGVAAGPGTGAVTVESLVVEPEREAGREPGPPRTPIPLATRDSPDLDQHDPAADLVTAPATASGAEELGDAPNLCLFRICYAVMNDHSVLILEGTNINHTCCPVRAQGC